MSSPFAVLLAYIGLLVMSSSFLYTSHFIWEGTNVSNITSFPAHSVYVFTNV